MSLTVRPVMAQKLVNENNVLSVKDLEKVKHLLNNHQKIGYTFFDEFQQRIPREEVAEVEQIVNEILPELDPKLRATICGSYRRGKATCGDIDMLLTHPDYTQEHKTPSFFRKLVEKLRSKGVITHDINFGQVKYNGVCRLPKAESLHRRIDILWIPYDQYFFGLLYFTGSGFFNIQMRRIALEKGFTLNEYEILPFGDSVNN